MAGVYKLALNAANLNKQAAKDVKENLSCISIWQVLLVRCKQISGALTEPHFAGAAECTGGCAQTFGTCGGGDNERKACCDPQDYCIARNAYYAQCRPIAQGPPAHWSPATITVLTCDGALLHYSYPSAL